MAPPGGLRLGEGDDSGRTQDEVRIIKEMLSDEIDKFVRDNTLDPAAARDLRQEIPSVQFAVLDRGDLKNCKNPSGALIGRIRDAKRGVLPPGGKGTRPPPGGPLAGLSGAELCGDFKRGACERGDRCRYSHGDVPTDGNRGGGAAPSYGSDLERFVGENRLDQGAHISLQAEPKDVLDKVIQMGPLLNATNPSAALMGRLRNVKEGMQSAVGGPGAARGGMRALPAPQPAMSPPAMLPPPSGQEAPASGFDNGRLNEEALKAIKQINMSEL